MLKHLPVRLLALISAVHLIRGDFVTTTIFPSCSGTNFPNFSYAKGIQLLQGYPVPFACLNTDPNPPVVPLTITWFYYSSYIPGTCGNPGLPDGDQCCHTTSTSTLTFYNTIWVSLPTGTAIGTSTGNVTSGAFLGHSATYVITRSDVNLNCNTSYGQEARTATVSVTIGNGPQCSNGGQIQELCPGAKFTL